MIILKNKYVVLLRLLVPGILFTACYKKQIQFGNDLADSHTRLITIDTITPVIVTYVLDSFPTSGNNILLLGRYKDPICGITTAQTYLQLGLPAGVADDLPADATFDSLVLQIKPTGYYYGDTTRPITLVVHELESQPEYTYANRLFNTSACNLQPVPLATVTQTIRPHAGDPVQVRLPDIKGLDFFNKIRLHADELQDETLFLEYFKGLSIQIAANDTGAVYAFATDSSAVLKLYYHTSNPVPEKKVFAFHLTRSSYQFNRITTNRTGTFMEAVSTGEYEFPATPAYPYGITQSGNGVLLKITFPSLRNLLQLDKVVQLLDAQLILKPVETTFDPYRLRLPPSLYLAQTDATNSIGYSLADPTGERILSSTPFIDDIYHLNTRYSYTLTSYINALLNTANSASTGVFVLEEDPAATKQLNRAVIGSRDHPKYRTQLVLTFLTIN